MILGIRTIIRKQAALNTGNQIEKEKKKNVIQWMSCL